LGIEDLISFLGCFVGKARMALEPAVSLLGELGEASCGGWYECQAHALAGGPLV